MTPLQQQFLSVLRSALLGQEAADPGNLSETDCTALLEMAQTQKILPLFFEAVYHWPHFQDSDTAAQTRRLIRQQVMAQTLRSAEFLSLNQILNRAGLRPLVVKGMICRDLYPQPDHRPSGDEDLLILPEQLPQYHQIFTDFGLQPATGDFQDAHEISYRKPGSALHIELHKSLFPPQSKAYGDFNRLFSHAPGYPISVTIQGSQVWTLEYTDHLLYLICHAFKHFLHSGVGIRQVCDIILFANRYGKQIQWDRIISSCREIRAEKFTAALFSIGEQYLCFDPQAADYPQAWRRLPVDAQPLLEDLLQGGLYGDSTMSRKHSSNITLDAFAASRKGKTAPNSLVSSLFPPAEKLEGQYPWMKEKPWLLPVAWCRRMVTYGVQSRKLRDNTPAQALKIGKKRMALLKEYDIIP